MTEETTRDFLKRRERELASKLEAVAVAFGRTTEELDEVRRALQALDPVSQPIASGGSSEVPSGPVPHVVEFYQKLFAQQEQIVPTDPAAEAWSIKSLVMAALRSERKFRFYGATSKDILDTINAKFDRKVDRSSLSPTLSRMRDEEMLTLSKDGKWSIASNYADKEMPQADI